MLNHFSIFYKNLKHSVYTAYIKQKDGVKAVKLLGSCLDPKLIWDNNMSGIWKKLSCGFLLDKLEHMITLLPYLSHTFP